MQPISSITFSFIKPIKDMECSLYCRLYTNLFRYTNTMVHITGYTIFSFNQCDIGYPTDPATLSILNSEEIK